MAASVVTPVLLPGLTREYLLQHRVCPRRVEDASRLVVAVTDSSVIGATDELAVVYDLDLTIEVVAEEELDRLIERFTMHTTAIDGEHTGVTLTHLAADVRDLVNQPPVIRYVNLVVREAQDAGASDIHLEAFRDELTARFRIDGILVPAPSPPPRLHGAIVSRIKLLAELDIAERRRPQDGRIRVRLESGELDLRVSTIPTVHGESVVLRLLDHGGRPVGLEELGFPVLALKNFERLIARPHGMVLVTGPTGSGKTTTLYAALQKRDGAREKIITIEDPVEYQLPGVTQIPVQRQAGITFATALRAILRQDPDVLMIGEMRDTETAEVAVQAAMTGHLVLSTLHTTDATSAIPRLVDLGVPDYLASATIDGVLAQRLVRRICPECKSVSREDPARAAELAGRPIGEVQLVRGAGCTSCRGTGYRGRLGLFELLTMDEDLRRAISRGASASMIKEHVRERGMRTLRDDGWEKVSRGMTTIDEVLRVIQD